MREKRVLVTGGAGFIGSHLCKKLKENGNKVVSLDNYFTGSEKNHIEGVKYIKGHTKDIEKYAEEIPDIVFHLGEYSRVEKSFDEPDIVWDLNKTGTFAVLEFCRKNNCKLIYAGSSTKFGDGGLGRDQSPYAWTKASNTELIQNYGIWYNLNYAITYFYNVYGPGEISTGEYATLIAIFQEKIKNKKPLTVVSPGTQKRNFTHVNDIINALLLVGEKGYGDEYGIGHPDSYSVKEIAEIFGGEIEMLPERKGNRMTARVYTEKTQSLGWKAQYDIKDYIKDFLKSIRNK